MDLPQQRVPLTAQAQQIKEWFCAYADSFMGVSAKVSDAVAIKRGHSLRVLEEMQGLLESIAANEQVRRCGQSAAILHDTGRFEQFVRFGTFADSRSVNHGELGLDLIAQHKVLDALDPIDAAMVTEAIRWHNRTAVSEELDAQTILLCRLVRDADKLDIYRVVAAHYETPHEGREEIIALGIPDLDGFTPSVVEQVLAGKIVTYASITRLNDFKAIQLGWVFDLNFKRSFEIVREHGYLERIRAALPDSAQAQAIYERARNYTEEQCRT